MLTRIKNKLVKLYYRLSGVNMGANVSIDFSLDVTNIKNLFLGDNSILYKNTSIYMGVNGECRIGTNSHVAPFGYLLIAENKVQIGNDVAIGPFCSMICHSNAVDGNSELFRKNYTDGDIRIGNNVFVGAQCTILPGSVIENNVVVASNSVVKGVLKSGNVYGGSPAKLIKSTANVD